MRGYYKSVVLMKKKYLKMKKMTLNYMMNKNNIKNKITTTIAMKTLREANQPVKRIKKTPSVEIPKLRIALLIRLRILNQLSYLMR